MSSNPLKPDDAGMTPASFYFIEGEDAARGGKKPADCRYIEGAIAWREWMAGYEAGTLDLSAFASRSAG
jgi:hypothetical protein